MYASGSLIKFPQQLWSWATDKLIMNWNTLE